MSKGQLVSKATPTQAAQEYEWKVKHAADVLIEAEGIKRDAKLLADVRKELSKREKDAKSARV